MKNDVGFWNEFEKYNKMANKALDFYIKSLQYPLKSEESQICRLSAEIQRREMRKSLKILTDYTEKHG